MAPKSKTKAPDPKSRNRYNLKEGYSVQEGDVTIHGPEVIYRTLEQAHSICWMLEEHGEVKQAWKDYQGATRKAEVDRKRREAKERDAAMHGT